MHPAVMQHALLLPIKSFRHKGFKYFFETGPEAGIQLRHAIRLQLKMQFACDL